MKILIAYDGGEPARRALDTGARLAKALDATIDVVSVVPVTTGRLAEAPWDDRSVHAAQLREADAMLREQGIEPTLLEPAGEPAATIERVAAKGSYDMVVVGSRGLNAVGRFLQGSISEHVATHAPTTVVVAR
jgi:nucleotide-binding universal stress UspA family protein